jgi:hypothetical protein
VCLNYELRSAPSNALIHDPRSSGPRAETKLPCASSVLRPVRSCPCNEASPDEAVALNHSGHSGSVALAGERQRDAVDTLFRWRGRVQ